MSGKWTNATRVAIVVGVTLRTVAAGVLIFGPWADDPGELAGWDVDRFVSIAEADGRPWLDHPVEYPPATVAAIELIAALPTGAATAPIVGFHRYLVVLSLAVDLTVAAVLARMFHRPAAAAYLVIGLPLIPMGFLRFDLWAALGAVVALAALRRCRPAVFGLVTTTAALIKAWPVLLVAVAASHRHRSATRWAVASGAVAGLAWILYGGGSLAPIHQVVSLRGATGWHVESLPGTLVTLTSENVAKQELNAYRIGTISPPLVTMGRLLVVAVAVLAWRRRLSPAAMMLATTASLLATSSLLSPQFLLWLTPWAAIVLTQNPDGRHHPRERSIAWLAVAAVTLTGVTLAVFPPPRLAETVPAALLLVRNGLLGATALVAVMPPVQPTETSEAYGGSRTIPDWYANEDPPGAPETTTPR